MKKFIIGLLCVGSMMIGGCGAQSKIVSGPDGNGTWVSITCRRNQANCIEEAGKMCPFGYDVKDKGGESGVFAYQSSTKYGSSSTVQSTYNGFMLVKCKGKEILIDERSK